MKRILLLTGGVLLMVLGGVGILVPILPTTPFVLLASGCFAASSEKLSRWLYRNPLFGEILINYKEKKGVRRIVKIRTLILLWIPLTVSIVLVSFWIKFILVAVGIAVSIHILLLRTKKTENDTTSSEKVISQSDNFSDN